MKLWEREVCVAVSGIRGIRKSNQKEERGKKPGSRFSGVEKEEKAMKEKRTGGDS